MHSLKKIFEQTEIYLILNKKTSFWINCNLTFSDKDTQSWYIYNILGVISMVLPHQHWMIEWKKAVVSAADEEITHFSTKSTTKNNKDTLKLKIK